MEKKNVCKGQLNRVNFCLFFFACNIHPSIHKTFFCLFCFSFFNFTFSLPLPDSSSAVNDRRKRPFSFFLFSRFNKIWKNIKWLEQGIERRKKKARFLWHKPSHWCFCPLDSFDCKSPATLSLSTPLLLRSKVYIVISGYSPPEPLLPNPNHIHEIYLKQETKMDEDHTTIRNWFYFCGWLDFFPYFIAHLRFSFRHTLSNLCVQCRFLALFFFYVCLHVLRRSWNQ